MVIISVAFVPPLPCIAFYRPRMIRWGTAYFTTAAHSVINRHIIFCHLYIFLAVKRVFPLKPEHFSLFMIDSVESLL